MESANFPQINWEPIKFIWGVQEKFTNLSTPVIHVRKSKATSMKVSY